MVWPFTGPGRGVFSVCLLSVMLSFYGACVNTLSLILYVVTGLFSYRLCIDVVDIPKQIYRSRST